MTLKTTATKYIPAVICSLLLLGTAFFCLKKPALQREDYDRIDSERYSAVFLSMYPIETYSTEDYAYFYNTALFRAAYEIPDYGTLRSYMKKIARSGNVITTVYLGICPDKVEPEQLAKLFETYPSVVFETVLAYPSADYWRSLSEQEYQNLLSAYTDFLSALPNSPNGHFYLPAQMEWLIANPGNYETDYLVNSSVARCLMLYLNADSSLYLTPDNAASAASGLSQLTERLRTSELPFPDLSDYCIVFFGDSIIGNYTGSSSVPGVVGGLTNASVYNLGYGGNSAALSDEKDITLPGIAESFCKGDLSVLPRDTQVYRGFYSYLDDSPSPENLCFVISYGLNDYFSGYPLAGGDPEDIHTYTGALRTAVATLQSSYPDARIILCTPTFVNIFNQGTEPHGNGGNVLEDYVNAALAVAEECNVTALDNFHSLGINAGNQGEYLADQVHLNEAGRYLMGFRIASLIK